MTTTADLLVEELRDRGVPFIATLNGHGLDPFLLACKRAGMRMIDVRNEQAASYMAEVTGRLSRTVGVCAVSGAVAHANALTGVLNAWFDGVPMLLITGITPRTELGWGNFQDFDPVPMAAPICKYARILDVPQRVGQIVHEAFTAATTGRPGPVHLSFPMDVAAAEVDPAKVARSRVRSGEVRPSGAGAPKAIEQAASLIAASKQPLLIAGSGAYYARAEQALARFSVQQQMPVVIPIWDRGSVPEPIETFLGVIGSATGSARILPDADLVIMAGAEFDYRVGQTLAPALDANAKVIRIHSDEATLRRGLEADLSIQGSPAAVLEQLAIACQQSSCSPTTAWLTEARKRRDAYRDRCLQAAAKLPAGINSRDVVTAIGEVMTDDTIMLVDGGDIGQWFHQLMLDRYPGHWVTCGASGVVGWGLPGALAARALYPDRPIILLSGDGSFTFTIAELECAARQGLKFVAVVADDQRWGISVTGHMQNYGEPLYSMLGPTRLDQVAEGFGCRGVRIERLEALVPALRAALQEDRPVVIQVPINGGNPAEV
jgi:acetolactate synthase-1/2/3 large subunit